MGVCHPQTRLPSSAPPPCPLTLHLCPASAQRLTPPGPGSAGCRAPPASVQEPPNTHQGVPPSSLGPYHSSPVHLSLPALPLALFLRGTPKPSLSPAYRTGAGMWPWPRAAPSSSTRIQTGGAMQDLRSGSRGEEEGGGRRSEEPRPPYPPLPLLAWHPTEEAMKTARRTQERSGK